MANSSVESFHSSIFQDGMLLDQQLKKHCLWRKSLPRDGESIYRAISELLYGSQIFFSKVKAHYHDFILKHPDQLNVMNSRIPPYLITSFDLHSNKTIINLSVLSQLFRIRFEIFHDGSKVQAVPDIAFSFDYILSLARQDDCHFDLIYPDFQRDTLAFVQSLIYTILYNKVFQLEVPFNKKNFTLQTIRESFFLTQDAYEFSHLERCFNTSYFENISLCLWRSEFYPKSNLALNISNSRSTYSLGDEVRVYSPNTENKPYYLGKIINLNVTPGMHEVLASNRGTEIVDIGHLQPAIDDDETSHLSSPIRLPNPEESALSPVSDPIKIVDDKLSSHGDFVLKQDSRYDTARKSDLKIDHSSNSDYISANSSFSQLNNWEHNSKSSQAPPGFEDQQLVDEMKQIDEKNCSIAFKSTPSHSIQGPKHKYGPQSAVVKQKFQYDHNLNESDSPLVMKPFEQIYETAHSQIKKLQFKLNNSPSFLSPKFSIHPEGSDLPEDKFILQYFYNLGVQYQLMRSHGSSWKDVLPNSCPPLYHDSNFHANNQLVPFMFRDTAGLYFSQDMVVPNYFYDMAMMPFIQSYAPPLSYNMQGEPFMVQNYGKHYKEESDSEKFHSSLKQDALSISEENIPLRSSQSNLNTKSEFETRFPNPRPIETIDVSHMSVNSTKPLDDLQADPTSWPQPGGESNDISWINTDLIENQRTAYSNALKRGTQSKQPVYTAERTIYASNNSTTSVSKNSLPKRNFPNSQNIPLNSYSTRKS